MIRGEGAWRGRGARGIVASVLGGASLFVWVALLWMSRPFQTELGAYRTSLADRTAAQRHNIQQAVKALDGVVIEPGATFSFNETVGPRTPERGYRQAPAFLERDLVTSVGGGICQVSSTLYNAAALSGLAIVERHPHFRRVASVPPGRDATVWYGMADLRLANRSPHPVRLSLAVGHEALSAAIEGNRRGAARIRVETTAQTPSMLGSSSFETVRRTTIAGEPALQEVLSRDVYRN